MKPLKDFLRLADYAKVFPINDQTIIAYDNEIYCNYDLPEHLIVHEKTHHRQQEKIGLDVWVEKYLTDNRFRIDMELEAYQAQLNSIKDRNERFKVKQQVLKTLSSELYGYIITYQDAQKLLK